MGRGGTIKVYGITGGEAIASVITRNALANKRDGMQLALDDSRLILITASNAQVLQAVKTRCEGKKLEQESVTSPASPLLAEVRRIGDMGSKRHGNKRKH